MPLLALIALYIVASVLVGLYAARRVHTSADFAVAGRSLPLAVIIATTFATWFGSETVMGAPAQFMQEGLGGIVEEPFGTSFCLVLVGLFFARALYRKKIITLGDYYRLRYGHVVEMLCSLIIVLSYLGWVGAQITALGLVINVLSDGAIPTVWGMTLGTAAVLVYTLYGGMWSVAVTDFVQMIVIVLGLVAIAWRASDLAGGAGAVLAVAASEGKLQFWPTGGAREWMFFVAAAITTMFGSIPQQDVFQRVLASRDEHTAQRGPVIGGLLYLAFAFVPIFTATAALLVLPNARELLANDPQRILPALVMGHMPMALQIAFFGALLSAIMSTASATMLAPATTVVENIWRNLRPNMDDAHMLRAMRISTFVFTLCVLAYAIAMEGSSIYELVSNAYQMPLVGAFVPLACGVYWKRATTQGALASTFLGLATWILLLAVPALGEAFPPQLAGVIAALAGMVAGSLAPQWLPNQHDAMLQFHEENGAASHGINSLPAS